MRILRNDIGATALEFAVVFPIILMFTLGVIQIACLIWMDNLLHYSVDVAARCYVTGRKTAPCDSSGDMINTATSIVGSFATAFGDAPTFSINTACQGSGGSGLTVTYTARFALYPLPKNKSTTMSAS